jgi:DnaK suppressor protein
MTPEEKIQLKKAIEEKMEDSKKAILDLREASKPMGLDSAIGRISRMDYINNKSISESELLKAESKLRALERWLSIYDTDQFGKCTKCGQEININRLLLLPESTRCIRCANR